MANVEFPEKLRFLLEPWRYKIALSGRGAAKSWSYARALLLIGVNPSILGRQHDSMFIVCARETMKSINDSVHRLLAEQIKELELQDEYDIQQNAILGKNNHTEFVFHGLRHNIKNIKSVESADIVWVEEAANVSKESWDILIPTIRKDKSEIWVSFNPELDTDETYKRFVLNPPPTAKVVRLSWEDNPWFPQVLRDEMEYMRQTDPEKCDHIYGGQTTSAVEGAIFKLEMKACEEEGRICSVPYDRTRPVQTFWDLGFDDCTSIWFVQPDPIAGVYRIIDHMEDSGKTLDWYVRQMQAREYVYGAAWLPWDGLKRYKKLGGGKSTEEILRKAGFQVRFVSMLPVFEGINAMRMIFPQCVFDRDKCTDGLQSLRRYQWGPMVEGRKQREPLHNDASHSADAARYMAIAIRFPEAKPEDEDDDRRKIPGGRQLLGSGGSYAPFS